MTLKSEPCFLTAAQASAAIRAGTLTCEQLVRSCLDRIEARDPLVKAWLHLDPARALRWARETDKRPAAHPLHGLPIGIKDVMDTADMPTTQNSPYYQGHQPSRDAACVAITRAKGALILGKTDTVEYASGGRKAATGNPFNLGHTPGGSSSGSAAAVGDFQVPLAFGTQTAGSLIRPASFNGIYGFKPSWGVVSAEGMKQFSVSLDTVGWYGRSVEDLALLASALQVPSVGDAAAPTIDKLRIAYCETPYWGQIEPAGRAALEAAAQRLSKAGASVSRLSLPEAFAGLADAQTAIMHGEGRASFLPQYLLEPETLHPELALTARGERGVTPEILLAAYALAGECRPAFDEQFADFDVVLTPAAPGEAPEGLQNVGSWIFNSFWTLLHVPCLAIPATKGALGLPVGIQLVGPRMADARLLAIASTIAPFVDIEAEDRLRTLRS